MTNLATQMIRLPDKEFYEIVAIRLNLPVIAKTEEIRLCTEEERQYYLIEYLVDELFLQIAGTKEIIITSDGKRITIRKYYNRALRLWRFIPIAKPTPEYIINLSDLTPRITLELKSLTWDDNKYTYSYVLKQAVGRIFENIVGPKKYHLNIARKLKVRLDR